MRRKQTTGKERYESRKGGKVTRKIREQRGRSSGGSNEGGREKGGIDWKKPKKRKKDHGVRRSVSAKQSAAAGRHKRKKGIRGGAEPLGKQEITE